ncbi:MAG: hypothetical protein K6F95_09425 [Selenomonas sp.]|nr:hypothetical protein [Selenomonas sp.]
MMKLGLLLLALCLLTSAGVASAAKKTVEQERAEINQLSQKALSNLYQQKPKAKNIIQGCYAYATLSSSSVKLGLLGDARGRGLAINHHTGEKVYLRMKQMGLGLGLGATEYDLIFLIANEEAWKSFVIGKTRFLGNAAATAKDGVSGGSYDGADYVANGIWMYKITKKGLALEVSLNGTKIYADKKLNASNKNP